MALLIVGPPDRYALDSICTLGYIRQLSWKVLFHAEFLEEYRKLPLPVQDEIAAMAEFLSAMGPSLKRPYADTLNGSRFANMKELRFDADDGVWRLAYAFDPQRKAILLVAGDKSEVSTKRFYKTLIAKADARFAGHLDELKIRSTTK